MARLDEHLRKLGDAPAPLDAPAALGGVEYLP